MLAGEILHRAAARFPDKPAVIEGDRALSYRALDQAADRCARALATLGLPKGAVIAILSGNRLEHAIAHFGAARSGLALAHISTRSTAGDLVHVLDKIRARALFFQAESAALVAAARAQLQSPPRLFAIGDADLPEAGRFDAFMMAAPDAPPPVALADDDVLGMTFTGGTTGFPKAVVVTHRARYASAVTVGVEFGLDDRDVCVCATPMFHAAGLFVWFQPAIMLGCTAVLLPSWDAAAFMALVERHRATATLLVPSQIADLLGHPAFDPARLATLRHVSYAGSPMPLALQDRLRAALPAAVQVENYGQSETGPMTVRGPHTPHEKRGSIGRPAHNVETRIADPDGNAVAAGVVGEIVTRGEHLVAEYFGEPEQTAALFKSGDGWLWTGDLGYRDAEGYLHLVDRAKDMIVSGAENIYPTELENALYRHPAVAECAVFGIPDDKWGEVPAAHVVLREGKTATAEELIDFACTQVARWKRPRLVEFVDRLPRTAIGKIQKHVIRAPFWKGRERKI